MPKFTSFTSDADICGASLLVVNRVSRGVYLPGSGRGELGGLFGLSCHHPTCMDWTRASQSLSLLLRPASEKNKHMISLQQVASSKIHHRRIDPNNLLVFF